MIKLYTSNVRFLFLFVALSLIPFINYAGLTYTSSNLNGGTGNFSDSHSWDLNNGLTPGSSDNIVISNIQPITIDVAANVLSVTINAGATLTMGANHSLTMSANISGSGTLDASALGNTVFYNTPANTIFATAFYQNVTLIGASTYHLAANQLVKGNWVCNAASKIDGTNGKILSLGGNYTDLHGLYNASFNVTFVGLAGVTQTVSASLFLNMTLANAPTATVLLAGTLELNGDLVFNAGSGTLDVSASNFEIIPFGNWTNNGGTFNPRKGIVDFASMSVAGFTIKKTGGTETFYNLQKQNNGKDIFGSNITVTNTVLLNAGTLDCSSFTFNVAGNWTNNGCTFTPGTGTVNFNPSTASNFVSNTVGGVATTESFNNVTKNNNTYTTTLQSGISVLGNLNISGGTFSVNNSNQPVSITGNMTVSAGATFSANSGTVTLNGGSSQTLSGTISFFNLTVTNTGGVNFSTAGLSVTNTATFNGSGAQSFTGTGCTFKDLVSSTAAGATFNAGTYTISHALSSTAGTLGQAGTATVTLLYSAGANTLAYIGAGAGGFSGKFIIQRFISTRNANWQDLATSVTNSDLFTDWDQQMYISGIGGRSGTACCPTFYSINTWNESTEKTVPVTSDITLTPMVGYETWCQGAGANWTNTTLSTKGTPLSSVPSNPSVSLSFTAGADAGDNRIGNPYASHIDWSLCTLVNTSATAYVLQNGAYTSFSGAHDIPAGQGFIAYATGAGASVTFPQTCKTVLTTTTWGREARPYNLMFRLSAPEINEYFQENYINFNDRAKMEFEDELDARYIKSPETTAPQLCMVAPDGKRLTTNTFSAKANESVDIPMKAYIGADGSYKFESDGVNSQDQYSCTLLEDLKLHKIIDLKVQSTYDFDGKVTDSPDRFVLHLTRKATTCERILATTKPADAFFSDNQVSVYGNRDLAYVKFDLDQHTDVTITIYDVQGRGVSHQMNVSAFKETLTLDLSGEASGLYLVSVNLGGNHVVTKKIVISHQE